MQTDWVQVTRQEKVQRAGAATGGALGGLGGLLIGLGALAIPGIGPVIAGGAVATALATAVTGGAIGAAAGGLTGGLVGLGIPENRARLYSDRINRGDYVIFVDGTDDEVRRAEAILRRRGIEDFETFDQPDIQNRTSDFTPNPAVDGMGASPMGYAVTPDPISGIWFTNGLCGYSRNNDWHCTNGLYYPRNNDWHWFTNGLCAYPRNNGRNWFDTCLYRSTFTNILKGELVYSLIVETRKQR